MMQTDDSNVVSKNGVIDGIRACCDVKKNADGEVSRVRGEEKVMCNFEDSKMMLEAR